MTPRKRINGFHTWALILSAAFVDIMQFFLTFIPIVGPFIAASFALVARIIFWIWFKLLRVGFADKSNRYVVNVLMTLGEIMPIINALPGWLIGTVVIIQQVKKEDAEYNKKQEEEAMA